VFVPPVSHPCSSVVAKTLANRRRLGNMIPEQSDRLARVARVIAAAEETFGNAEKAAVWLRRPTTALAGEKPLELLEHDVFTRAHILS
jgi:putative toxin-antitoxin system antitoxin component (TIGR02293 family)